MKANSLPEDYIDDKVLEYLSANYSKNVRELEGPSQDSCSPSRSTSRKATSACRSVRRVFDDDEKDAQEGQSRYRQDHLRRRRLLPLTESQIKSNVRTSQIALARQIAMYLSRQLLSSLTKSSAEASPRITRPSFQHQQDREESQDGRRSEKGCRHPDGNDKKTIEEAGNAFFLVSENVRRPIVDNSSPIDSRCGQNRRNTFLKIMGWYPETDDGFAFFSPVAQVEIN